VFVKTRQQTSSLTAFTVSVLSFFAQILLFQSEADISALFANTHLLAIASQ
jgi:hypothetical protein